MSRLCNLSVHLFTSVSADHGLPEYCCPNDTPLQDCTWRGSAPDCTNANCEKEEVEVDSHAGGSSWNLCSWGRKKALCCQVSKALPPPLYCKKKTCDLEPNACNQDGDDEWGNPMKKRDLLSIPTFGAHRHGHGPDHHHGDYSFLEKRGPKRPFAWKTAAGLFITQVFSHLPDPRGLHEKPPKRPTGYREAVVADAIRELRESGRCRRGPDRRNIRSYRRPSGAYLAGKVTLSKSTLSSLPPSEAEEEEGRINRNLDVDRHCVFFSWSR